MIVTSLTIAKMTSRVSTVAGGTEQTSRSGLRQASERPRGLASSERDSTGNLSQETPGGRQSADRADRPAAQSQAKVGRRRNANL